MKRPARFLSLRLKLTLYLMTLSLTTIGVISYWHYQNTKTILRQDISNRLRDAVAIAALQVDGDLHARLISREQEGSPEYLQLKKTLQAIRDAGSDFRFVYTMRQDEQGNIVFVVDAEESEQDVSHVGDVYYDASDWLKAHFATLQTAQVEDDLYTDRWGTWLTGYAPIYTSDGRREAVLGIDIAAHHVLAQEQSAFRLSVVVFLASIPIVAVTSHLISTLLTAPLTTLTQGAQRLSERDFSHRVLIQTNDEFNLLGQALNLALEELGNLIARLEEQVEERTREVSRRMAQLQATIQVARQAADIRDVAQLLNDAVRLISEQFGFYHAGIFLLDEANEYAVLQAASSIGGQRMLNRGHRFKVGEQGIVGYVAAQKRPRIALDTGADAVFNNPDLPQTRSEAALPLMVHDRIIGVLDIQSMQPQAFTAEDIEILQGLADQIALAIENARLFEEMNRLLRELEGVAAKRVQRAWNAPAQAKHYAYHYTPLGVQLLPPGEIPSHPGKHQLELPIVLHNQTIGKIAVMRQEKEWEPREKATLQKIVVQLGLALENARLFEESQRRAERERAISEVSARIHQALDMELILRTAAAEVQRAFRLSEVTIHLTSPPSEEA